jgi:hypothetical protein
VEGRAERQILQQRQDVPNRICNLGCDIDSIGIGFLCQRVCHLCTLANRRIVGESLVRESPTVCSAVPSQRSDISGNGNRTALYLFVIDAYRPAYRMEEHTNTDRISHVKRTRLDEKEASCVTRDFRRRQRLIDAAFHPDNLVIEPCGLAEIIYQKHAPRNLHSLRYAPLLPQCKVRPAGFNSWLNRSSSMRECRAIPRVFIYARCLKQIYARAFAATTGSPLELVGYEPRFSKIDNRLAPGSGTFLKCARRSPLLGQEGWLRIKKMARSIL